MNEKANIKLTALRNIIEEYGLPVYVRKARWTDGFILRVDSFENGMATGTAFKDGEVYVRSSGAYSYRLTDDFCYLGKSLNGVQEAGPSLDNEKNTKNDRTSEESEELKKEKVESGDFLSHFKKSDIVKHRGVIKDKAFGKTKKLVHEITDAISEEKTHLSQLLDVIKKLIGKLSDQIQNPSRPGWEPTSQYKGAPLNSDMAEYFGIMSQNNDLRQDISSLKETENYPYFSHISLLFEDENNAEDVFIGERLVYDEGWPHIVSWQSPLGALAYDNEKTKIELPNGYKAEILLKRNVVIKNKNIENVLETFNRRSQLSKIEEAMVYDEFLVKVLQEKRSHKELTNIIPSIQSNQNQIIRAPLRENYIVQGCAGCGKTMILLHRMSYLLYNYRTYHQKNFIMLAPSRRFKEHVKPLVENLRLQDISIKTLSDYYLDYLCSNYQGWNDIKEDKRLFGDNGKNAVFADYFYSAEYAEQLKARVDKRMASLKKNEEAIIELIGEKTEKKNKNAPEKQIAEIESKIDSLKRKRRISIFDDEFADIIPQGLNVGKRKKPLNKAELYATTLLNYYCYGNRNAVPFVFVDEAQDIAPQEFVLLRAMNPNAVFNVYGDVDQQIFSYTNRSGWDDLEQIGDFEKYSIGENYRNTLQITEFINDELMMGMVGLGLEGDAVKEISVEEINAVKKMAEDEDRIAILYASNRDEDTLPEEISEDETFTVKDVKGMEFETVIVLPNSMNDNELYIAYSRALKNLYVCNE